MTGIGSPEIRQMSEETAAEPHSESNGTRTWKQSLQPRESGSVKEQQGWIIQAEWNIYIQENSDDNDRRSPSNVSIFRVPGFLKNSKREAYVPQTVSLGPYHHRSAELSSLGNHKGRALRRMRTRFNDSNSDASRMRTRFNNSNSDANNIDFSDRAREEIIKLENQIRDSYEEKIDCNRNTLALMLSLDGCFILEILRALDGDDLPNTSKYYDPIFKKTKIDYVGFDTVNDIVILENQIPLVVLEKLLELEFKSEKMVRIKLLSMLRSLLSMYFSAAEDIDFNQCSWPQEQVHHLLGLLHSFIVSPDSNHAESSDGIDRSNSWSKCIESNSVLSNLVKSTSSWRKYIKFRSVCCSPLQCFRRDVTVVNNVRRIHRAIELKKAGIKFKRCNQGIKMIKFDRKSATIFLPHITVMDRTEVLFRNLIAFEICKPSSVNYITCYVSLMDELIDSEEDVALLRKSDIVTNYLGSDTQVAELFNGLFKNVTESETDAFADLKGDVSVHYKNEIKVKLAEFMKEYFSSPWKPVALAGAILIVLLTVVQTIFSVLSFYK